MAAQSVFVRASWNAYETAMPPCWIGFAFQDRVPFSRTRRPFFVPRITVALMRTSRAAKVTVIPSAHRGHESAREIEAWHGAAPCGYLVKRESRVEAHRGGGLQPRSRARARDEAGRPRARRGVHLPAPRRGCEPAPRRARRARGVRERARPREPERDARERRPGGPGRGLGRGPDLARRDPPARRRARERS